MHRSCCCVIEGTICQWACQQLSADSHSSTLYFLLLWEKGATAVRIVAVLAGMGTACTSVALAPVPIGTVDWPGKGSGRSEEGGSSGTEARGLVVRRQKHSLTWNIVLPAVQSCSFRFFLFAVFSQTLSSLLSSADHRERAVNSLTRFWLPVFFSSRNTTFLWLIGLLTGQFIISLLRRRRMRLHASRQPATFSLPKACSFSSWERNFCLRKTSTVAHCLPLLFFHLLLTLHFTNKIDLGNGIKAEYQQHMEPPCD